MRKLWNRPNQAVWSLATTDQNGLGNMNICTYVSAVSMEPKLMMVAVYHNTKTLANVVATKRALLQLLSEDLAAVTKVCGHLSGNSIDKISRLKKRHPLGDRDGIPYFSKCAGYLELELQKLLPVDGDHDLAIFTVLTHKNLHDTPILTTDYMRAKGLLR